MGCPSLGGIYVASHERWLGRPKVDGRSNRQKQLTQRMMLSETRSLSVASTRQRRVRTWNKTSIDRSIDRSLTAMAGWLIKKRHRASSRISKSKTLMARLFLEFAYVQNDQMSRKGAIDS
jgi:hypothetical protein